MIMEDYPLHYYFIGRLLGKALYENLLVELPLASFFLCKMTGTGTYVRTHVRTYVCMYVCVCTLQNIMYYKYYCPVFGVKKCNDLFAYNCRDEIAL